MTETPPAPERPRGDLAIVLSGGGARAAYQIGLLRCLARHRPDLTFQVITGVSAGAINAIFLAAHPGPFPKTAADLSDLWSSLTADRIFRTDSPSLTGLMLRWAGRLTSGGSKLAPGVRGLVETSPLRQLLVETLPRRGEEILGIADNLERGRLKAVALSTLNYSTGQTITWVQGRDIQDWERTYRKSVKTHLTVDHVMASAALPLFFPAIRIGRDFYGDGGVRLAAPLSPALHLGADRILVISTRYRGTRAEADEPETVGYPPPAQILGHMLNAVFLDVIDEDIRRLELVNSLLEKIPPEECPALKPVGILALRPSQDLARLAAQYEPQLPSAFRFLTRSLGTRETKSPDFLSMLMFQPDYLKQLIEIGEADAEARMGEIAGLVGTPSPLPGAELGHEAVSRTR